MKFRVPAAVFPYSFAERYPLLHCRSLEPQVRLLRRQFSVRTCALSLQRGLEQGHFADSVRELQDRGVGKAMTSSGRDSKMSISPAHHLTSA